MAGGTGVVKASAELTPGPVAVREREENQSEAGRKERRGRGNDGEGESRWSFEAGDQVDGGVGGRRREQGEVGTTSQRVPELQGFDSARAS